MTFQVRYPRNTMLSDDSLDTRNTIGLAGYPSSGAYAHLPIRTTITGQAMISHPNANKIFLRSLPGHCYTLPNVPLNFTLVEIIVLLPNWFKNMAIASRFMNNCLTTNVHFAILEEHRDCNFASDHEREKAKKTITDKYRKTMRSITNNGGWTKAKHKAPLGWNHMVMSMDGFVPDDTRLDGYLQLPPIPFHDLMNGVKKLPKGTDAGDLAHALQFALTRPEHLMFPDDLPRILEHIGRTQITTAHTDRSLVRAYAGRMRKEAEARRPKRDWDSGPSPEERIALKKARAAPRHVLSQHTTANAPQQYPRQLAPTTVSTPQGQVVYRPWQASVEASGAEMDALLRPHLTQESFQAAPTPTVSPLEPYHPRRLLRECIEGHVGFDGSPLARAARFAQQPQQIGMEWCVENVSGLVQLLDDNPQIEASF